MDETNLSEVYQGYIACLNAQDWQRLGYFVDDNVKYNGNPVGLSGYREMLEKDFRDIPDLSFKIQLLVCEPPYIACRLHFDCAPLGMFLGLPVHGQQVAFSENVFYRLDGDKVQEVWSVIDKAAIERQL